MAPFQSKNKETTQMLSQGPRKVKDIQNSPSVSGELARPSDESLSFAGEFHETVSFCEWEFKRDSPDVGKETVVKEE